MLKDGMHLCDSCGRSTSGVECTNPGCQDALASARLASVTAERDEYLRRMCACHLTFDKYGMDQNNELLDVLVDRTVREFWTVTSDRDALSDALADVRQQLAALKNRLADAPKTHAQVQHTACWIDEIVPQAGLYALVHLEDGE